MAEERTLGLARAREDFDENPSKEDLQRRMEEARESISNTVTEIKENVAQQVESVKDALDWREHFKKRPVAWSLGAASVGFFVGYGIAAALDQEDNETQYASPSLHAYAAQPVLREGVSSPPSKTTEQKDEGPGMLERFKETPAYERLSKEAGALGDRLIEELSTTAQLVVLPFLLKKIKNWIGVDLSDKNQQQASMRGNRPRSTDRARRTANYQPVVDV